MTILTLLVSLFAQAAPPPEAKVCYGARQERCFELIKEPSKYVAVERQRGTPVTVKTIDQKSFESLAKDVAKLEDWAKKSSPRKFGCAETVSIEKSGARSEIYCVSTTAKKEIKERLLGFSKAFGAVKAKTTK